MLTEALKKPSSPTMATSSFFSGKVEAGLFIDTSAVYAARVQKNKTGIEFLGSARAELNANPEALSSRLSEAVKETMKGAGVEGQPVFLSLPGEEAMVRCFDLPWLPKKEWPSAIRFEAQKYLPFPINNLYFDYELFPSKEEKKISVVFSAAKKEAVDRRLEPLREIGVRVQGVELVYHSIARFFSQEVTKGSPLVHLIIQANDEKTAEIVLAKDQAILIARHAALVRKPEGELDLNAFISEITISLDYFSKRFKHDAIEKVYIHAGNPAWLKGLDLALEKEFHFPVETVRPRLEAKHGVHAVAVATAFGLALRDRLPSTAKKINLLPTSALQVSGPIPWEQEKKMLVNLAIKEASAVVAVLVLSFMYLQHMTTLKKAAILSTKAPFAQSQTTSIDAPAAELGERQVRLSEKMAFVAKAVDKREYFTVKMNEIARNIPADMRLTRLSYADAFDPNGAGNIYLRFEGYIRSTEKTNELSAVNKLLSVFNEDKEFMKGIEEIKITSIMRALVEGAPVTKFAIECAAQRKVPS